MVEYTLKIINTDKVWTQQLKKKNIKPVLVTGIAGFIGFHLAKKLLTNGYPIIGIDNLDAYYDVSLKTSRLKQLGFSQDQVDTILNPNPGTGSIQLKAPQKLVFYRVDLKEQDAVKRIFEQRNRFTWCTWQPRPGYAIQYKTPMHTSTVISSVL